MKRQTRMMREQKGAVFLVVLILMLVSSLMITPLIAYMYSGRIATSRHEVRMDEYYSADAGVEDAILKIKLKSDLPTPGGPPKIFSMATALNRKTMNSVTIRASSDNETFKIESIAMTSPGSGTSITSVVRIANFYNNFLNNAITSPTAVDLSGGHLPQVSGNISVPASGLNPPGYLLSGRRDYPAAHQLATLHWVARVLHDLCRPVSPTGRKHHRPVGSSSGRAALLPR